MKKIYPVYCLLLSILISSCAIQKDYIIESDYSYSGRFNKYKTYTFLVMQDADSTNNHKDIIEKNISSKMSAQAYKKTSNKPDLFISYKVFNDNFEMKGYQQPEFDI